MVANPCGLVIKGKNIQVPLKDANISVSVHGFLANVEACLKYSNTESNTLEVVFLFPMDDNSAVYKCEADIDGRHIVAEIQEKEQARETYNEAVLSDHSAVLMEEHDTAGDVFRCSLGNLPPNSDTNINFAFVTELHQEADGSLKFVLPTVLNPRYNPSKEDGGTKENTSFSNMNSCSYEMEFKGRVSCKHGSITLWSDTDKLITSLDTVNLNTMKIELAEQFRLDHDITFNVLYEDTHKPQTTFERGKKGELGSLLTKDLLMLSFYPDLADTVTAFTSEYIFMVDRSNSMEGKPIQSVKEAMLYFLKSLPVGCFFNIISFGSTFSALFPEGSKPYEQKSLKEAMKLQGNLRADMGGTVILRPLEFIFSKKVRKGYPRQIFLLTDGRVSNANEVITLVKKKSRDSRIFTVGIGDGVSTSLVRNVAKAGGGQVEFVTGNEKLQQKVMKLLKTSSQSAVTDLRVNLDLPSGLKIDMLLPTNMPVIFSGQRCIVYAFIDGQISQESSSFGKAELTGMVDGKLFTDTMTFDVIKDTIDTSGHFVHRMAMKNVIKDLEMDENFKDSPVEKKREIILVSTAANVASKYTSFVGVDKEKNEKIGQSVSYYIRSNRREYRHLHRPVLSRLPACCCRSSPVATVAKATNLRLPTKDWYEPDHASSETHLIYYDACFSSLPLLPQADFSIPQQSSQASALVMIQEFDGSWSLSEDLAKIVGVERDKLRKNATVKDENIWATCVAVCWLTIMCPEKQTLWEMVVSKARDWLVKQLGGQPKLDKLLKDVEMSFFSS